MMREVHVKVHVKVHVRYNSGTCSNNMYLSATPVFIGIPNGFRYKVHVVPKLYSHRQKKNKLPLSVAMQNDKRATRSDSLFKNGVVSIKSCSHAETYRIVKTYILTMQRYK